MSNFQALIILTLDRVTLLTIMHHTSTVDYTPNFIEIEETFCGRTVVRTDAYLRPALLSRLWRVDLTSMWQRSFLYSNKWLDNEKQTHLQTLLEHIKSFKFNESSTVHVSLIWQHHHHRQRKRLNVCQNWNTIWMKSRKTTLVLRLLSASQSINQTVHLYSAIG